MSRPLLAVLIPCLNGRPWQRIVDRINDQAEKYDCVVSHYADSGEMTSGQKRQYLCGLPKVKECHYRCFVDDDDDVSDDYMERLWDACRNSNADVISFNCLFTNSARPGNSETWRFGLHANNRRAGFMCVNHLCAWKTDIANRVAWCPHLGNGDDHVWFQPLFHAGLARTCLHINQTLYRYQYSPSVSVNQDSVRRNEALKYVGIGLRCFLLNDGEIYIEDGCQRGDAGYLTVRDRDNISRVLDTRIAQKHHYHTVTLG